MIVKDYGSILLSDFNEIRFNSNFFSLCFYLQTNMSNCCVLRSISLLNFFLKTWNTTEYIELDIQNIEAPRILNDPII